MKRFVFGFAIVAPLLSPALAQDNVRPENHRNQIVRILKDSLKDPTSVRDAWITEPFLGQMPNGQRYTVCVKLRAKNSFGAYDGVMEKIAIFYRGSAGDSLYPATETLCSGRKFVRFPEAEKIQF